MVDIFNYAKLLRESRKGMIENVVNWICYKLIKKFLKLIFYSILGTI
jgi:hypothetical protein